jgi:hypothetical protein
MSNIFDALQRAEAENAGAEGAGWAVATELLRSAEQKMRESALTVNPQPSADAFDANPPAPESPDGLERCPMLPFSIPEESRLVAVAEEGSLGAEKFRFLAVRLRHLRQNRPLKKVLITSTIPQEGKSTIAANLACTLARRKQQKTLMLEGDLRRPSLANQFGIGKIPGLCEWLGGQTESINIYRLERAGRCCTRKSSGTDAVWKVISLDGTVGVVVRLDRYRFSTGAAAGGHKHLVPLSRRNSAGHAKRYDRKTTAQARP